MKLLLRGYISIVWYFRINIYGSFTESGFESISKENGGKIDFSLNLIWEDDWFMLYWYQKNFRDRVYYIIKYLLKHFGLQLRSHRWIQSTSYICTVRIFDKLLSSCCYSCCCCYSFLLLFSICWNNPYYVRFRHISTNICWNSSLALHLKSRFEHLPRKHVKISSYAWSSF